MSLPELYSALADPTRLRVLEMLHEKARPVHELAAAFDISRPAISRHLRVLKEAGLVRELKQGRENVYSFQRAPLKSGAGWIGKYGVAPPAQTKAARKTKAVVTSPDPRRVSASKLASRAKRQTANQPAKTLAKPVSVVTAVPQLTLFDL